MLDGQVIVDGARVFVFVAFIAFAIRAALTRNLPVHVRRRAVSSFVVFTLAVSMGVGLIQREMWPFSTWPMDVDFFPAEYSGLRPVVVDDHGVEHEVDLRAFYPIDWMDLYGWFLRAQRKDANTEAFSRIAPWLVDLVATARRQLESTGHLPGARSVFAAPPRHVLPPVWTAGDSLTPLNVVGLRIYEFHTNLDLGAYDRAFERRNLVFEYLGNE